GWDGYPKARERLLRSVAESRIANPVVIGGDIHTGVGGGLKISFEGPKAPVIATEFVGTSITSQGIGQKTLDNWRTDNPHILYANGSRRGYTTIELTPRHCVARMRVLSDVLDPDARVSTLGAWTGEDGKPGAQRAS